uniref:mRNA export factor GLE1 n=1 Tax=Timema monikensis TaxID=170555 RepID=A0A7R9HRP6_9NEOP|nr:unnamed protein product [Timema monikensis]
MLWETMCLPPWSPVSRLGVRAPELGRDTSSSIGVVRRKLSGNHSALSKSEPCNLDERGVRWSCAANHAWQKEGGEAVKERVKKILREEQSQREILDYKQELLRRQFEAKKTQDEKLFLQQIQEDAMRAKESQARLEQHHKQLAQRVSERNRRIKEDEQRKREAEEDERIKIKEKKERLDKIHHHQLEFRTMYQKILDSTKLCKDRQALLPSMNIYSPKLKSLYEAIEQLVNQCKVGEVSSLDVKTAFEIVQNITSIQGSIQDEVVKINYAQEAAVTAIAAAKEQDENKAKEEAELSLKAANDASDAVSSATLGSELSEFVDPQALHNYMTLQQYRQQFESSYSELMNNEGFKKFRFECQKAVNVPVNAISHVSSAHMTDKYIKLSRLISGQPVEVGGSTVSASRHPQGVAFCKNLLAKKFVAQGELTVSSKPEAAFAIAAILVSLWVQFPDFGQLVLAHFHRECPYLVPLFMPQVENQSNQDFYKSLGYRYSEQGEVEKQPKFLKRMSGVMRLYTAIMVTRLRRQDQNKPHPHGLKQAWRWLVCMLNLEPKPDICATLILDFLEVSGYMMFATYGKEFQKLLHIICKDYFTKIQKITPSSSSGPMVRLETFLQKILKQGKIPPPEGATHAAIWGFRGPYSIIILGIDVSIEMELCLVRPVPIIQFFHIRSYRFHEPVTISLTSFQLSRQQLLGDMDFVGVHSKGFVQPHVSTPGGEIGLS